MTQIQLASWNVNSLLIRLEQVLQWLDSSQVDVLALQETKLIDEKFPYALFQECGYQVVFSGQKSYNGVAFISRHPIDSVLTDIPDLNDSQRRILVATVAGIRIVNLYVPNGASVDSDKYTYKLSWLQKVTNFVQSQLVDYPKLAVMGDFNIAPEDKDVHAPEEWLGSVLVSPLEREAFQALLELGFVDSFRHCNGEQQLFSWWDYRAGSFRRNRGLRIDHILLSEALKSYCVASRIDVEPRRASRPSDHTPIVTTLHFE